RRRQRRAATGGGSAARGVRPGNHGERGERAGERERQAQRRPTRRARRHAAGGRSEQPFGSAAAAALPRIVRRSRHDYPDGLLGAVPAAARSAPPRRNRVGSVSLALAAGGAAACHLGLRGGPFAGSTWLRVVAAGFEAATVGGFADWFAVTALFRHPLGLPIPHTAIIPARRAKIIEGIVTMVEEDWLS